MSQKSCGISGRNWKRIRITAIFLIMTFRVKIKSIILAISSKNGYSQARGGINKCAKFTVFLTNGECENESDIFANAKRAFNCLFIHCFASENDSWDSFFFSQFCNCRYFALILVQSIHEKHRAPYALIKTRSAWLYYYYPLQLQLITLAISADVGSFSSPALRRLLLDKSVLEGTPSQHGMFHTC